MNNVKNDKQVREEFVKEYQALCTKYNLEVFGFPKWLRDEKGLWMTSIQYGVDTYTPKKEEKKEEAKPVIAKK